MYPGTWRDCVEFMFVLNYWIHTVLCACSVGDQLQREYGLRSHGWPVISSIMTGTRSCWAKPCSAELNSHEHYQSCWVLYWAWSAKRRLAVWYWSATQCGLEVLCLYHPGRAVFLVYSSSQYLSKVIWPQTDNLGVCVRWSTRIRPAYLNTSVQYFGVFHPWLGSNSVSSECKERLKRVLMLSWSVRCWPLWFLHSICSYFIYNLKVDSDFSLVEFAGLCWLQIPI